MSTAPKDGPAARLELSAPPTVYVDEPFPVTIRLLNTGEIVERYVIDVAATAPAVAEPSRIELLLLPQQGADVRCQVTPDAGAVGPSGSPSLVVVTVRAVAEHAGTPTTSTVQVMVLAQTEQTAPAQPSAGLSDTPPFAQQPVRPWHPYPRQSVRPPPRDTYHLLADHPIENEGDLLGADHTARRIADIVLRAAAATPFTLGIQGGWGTGKSSLMQLVRRHVEARSDKRVRVAWFNAWTAEGTNALAALIRSVLRELDPNVLRRIVRRTRATSWLKLPFMVFGSWLAGRSLADEVWRTFAMDTAQRNEIRTEIQRALGDWADRDRSPRAGRLLVVFVDDLDRCSAENVAQVLEAIRLYLDAPGLVFVIGYDPDVVAGALLTARGKLASGRAYLEKIVQVDHAMAHPDAGQARELARLCARHCGVEHLLGDAELALIVARGQRNPRRIKRFLNTFVLAHQLDAGAARLWPAEHIKLLLVRMYFPTFFRLMTTDQERDVVRLLIELARFRGDVIAARVRGDDQVGWLCEVGGVAAAGPEEPRVEVLARLEEHLPKPIVELSRDRDLFTLLWSLGDDDQRADLLQRLRDPAALRALEPPAVPVPTQRPAAAAPTRRAPDQPCDHADAGPQDAFCPTCGAFLEWETG